MNNIARKSTIPLLLLLAVSAISVAGVAAQGKHKGGNGGGGGSCSITTDNWGGLDSTTGNWIQNYGRWCNGVPVAGYKVTWYVVYNYGSNILWPSTTGTYPFGTVLSIQLYTNSLGVASFTFTPSVPYGSYQVGGY